jgi:roadblock/LC7 domain-containing protein
MSGYYGGASKTQLKPQRAEDVAELNALVKLNQDLQRKIAELQQDMRAAKTAMANAEAESIRLRQCEFPSCLMCRIVEN